jgi:uncharacterized protein DUF4350
VSERDTRTPRTVLVGGAVLAVLTLISTAPERGSGPDSPSSSYSTGPTGSGAYAEVLARFDHPVERIRGGLDQARLDPDSTLVILDAELTEAEVPVVAGFLRAGGRVVAGGVLADGWLGDVVDDPPSFGDRPVEVAVPAAPAPETEGVATVRLGGLGSFAEPGGLEPLLGERDGPVVAAAGVVGDGRLVVLADTTPLSNLLLGVADNAAFGLGAVGPAGTPVAFAEGPHGYGSGKGLAALPGRWRLALLGLALSAGVWLVARSRRLGPPEDEFRDLAPRRRAYVDALAATLGRTGHPVVAAEPVRLRARSLLARRAGLPPDATDDALRPAAARLGLPADEVEALVGMHGDAGVLAAGRALARLEPGVRGVPAEEGAQR